MRLQTFFPFLQKKREKNPPKMDNIFLQGKKKVKEKKKAAAGLAETMASCWSGNRIFFYGQPQTNISPVRQCVYSRGSRPVVGGGSSS